MEREWDKTRRKLSCTLIYIIAASATALKRGTRAYLKNIRKQLNKDNIIET